MLPCRCRRQGLILGLGGGPSGSCGIWLKSLLGFRYWVCGFQGREIVSGGTALQVPLNVWLVGLCRLCGLVGRSMAVGGPVGDPAAAETVSLPVGGSLGLWSFGWEGVLVVAGGGRFFGMKDTIRMVEMVG